MNSNNLPPNQQIPEQPDPQVEALLHDVAQRYHYLDIPDIAGAVRQRLNSKQQTIWRPNMALRVVLLVLIIGLLTIIFVPQVRAFVLEVLRIGNITIIRETPTPTQTATLNPTETRTLRPTVPPTATPLPSVLSLAGETTLEDLQAQVNFAIPLPSYPADLGAPDRVYRTKLQGLLVTLVWLDHSSSGSVRLVLEILDPSAYAAKNYPFGDEQAVKVNGQEGLWISSVHQIAYFAGNSQLVRTVDANVLLWSVGRLTYRLETKLPLEEALKIAESLE
ncbi:MAG: hypothetical protein U0528_12995 [Anaerolineae bacterium]